MSTYTPDRCNIKAFCAVQDHSKATGADLTMLLIMCRYSDDNGDLHPSIPSLARCAHVSERAAQETIGRLVKAGELKILMKSAGGSPLNTNRLRITCVLEGVKPAAPVQSTAPVKSSVTTGAVERKGPVKRTAPEEPEEKNQKKEPRGVSLAAAAKIAQKNATPGKSDRKLWPAAQPAVAAVTDKHARWWTVVAEESDELEEYAAADVALIESAVVHVGGRLRFRGFDANPRAGDRARDDFLKFLIRHDPAYGAAVNEALQPFREQAEVEYQKALKARAKVAGRGS